MNILISLIAFIFAVGLLVTIHEFGHYIVGRFCGMKVLKFSIGFGKPIYSIKAGKDQTEYCVSRIPLGGYVKISGMIDESMDKEQMALPPEPYEFRSKPAYQRLLIMIGGVLVNFILAFLILFLTN